jgi:hypothetical protein
LSVDTNGATVDLSSAESGLGVTLDGKMQKADTTALANEMTIKYATGTRVNVGSLTPFATSVADGTSETITFGQVVPASAAYGAYTIEVTISAAASV